MKLTLKSFQYDYIYSKARYPALISAWGTGKSLCLILRAMIYSEEIPNNLGVIFRKEYTDLRDSTLKDFERYTGLTIDSQRNVALPNGSVIMFRHIEELNNIQNLNLGWFGIEQTEELETDKEFYLLWGRLRRQIEPTEYFKKLGLPTHSGFIVGNVAGDNWIKALWKNDPTQGYELLTASTFENADVLPKDYTDNLLTLKDKKPDIYRRFVLNDWEVESENKVFKNVGLCVTGTTDNPKTGLSYVLGVDLAKAHDYTVLTTICREKRHLVDFQRFNETSWSLQKQKIIETTRKYNNALVIADATGVGDPIVEDLQRAGLSILPYSFTNKSKEELIEKLIIAVSERMITIPNIEVLVAELRDFKCEIMPSKLVRYSAPEGKFDDCVISLALAIWGLGNFIYQPIRDTRQPKYTFRQPQLQRS